MSIDEILSQIVKETEKHLREKQHKIFLGELPYEIQREIRKLTYEKERMEQEMKLRVKQFELELQERMKNEFESRHFKLSDREQELWDKIYSVMNISPNEPYSYEHGKLYKMVGIKHKEDFSKPF